MVEQVEEAVVVVRPEAVVVVVVEVCLLDIFSPLEPRKTASYIRVTTGYGCYGRVFCLLQERERVLVILPSARS